MSSDLQFIYKKEFWYISAFINSELAHPGLIAKEFEEQIIQKVQTLKDDDINRFNFKGAEDIRNQIIDMGKHSSIECEWKTYIDDFPYTDENTEEVYDRLGYFVFNVEYYKDSPEKKELIRPIMIQQIPLIVKDILIQSSQKRVDLFVDEESPMFVFITSDKTKPANVKWSDENINMHKRTLGYWTEVYSGSWDDYTDALFERRVRHNLSNRESELHFIRRNSGFIYMAEQNYQMHFKRYMIKNVLVPTSQIRAILFALISINRALDTLFMKRYTRGVMSGEVIENKLNNLRYLRGLLQTKLSMIYDELDYNRRQHFTAVLTHLVREFGLKNLLERINHKFSVIYDSMEELYMQKNEENQKKQQKGLELLNFLFGLGIFVDIIGLLTAGISSFGESNVDSAINLIVFVVLLGFFIPGIVYVVRLLKSSKKPDTIGKTVDALLTDGEGNIILLKRVKPPYLGFYSIPGTFIREGENYRSALSRLFVKKLDIKAEIGEKLGSFNKPGRDPRGNVSTTVYRCKIIDMANLKGELIRIEDIKGMRLAFDHGEILNEILLKR
ncbi:MAG: NUDIX domain-containing protein [Promethearchaeota archaeon]